MRSINSVLKKCEEFYEKNKVTDKAFFLILKYYEAYDLTENLHYLQKAYYISEEASKKNQNSIALFMLKIFIEICSGYYLKISEYLKRISVYSVYLKNNEQNLYCFYLYLQVFYSQKTEKNRNMAKYYRKLEDFVNDSKNIWGMLLLAKVNIEHNAKIKAGEYLAGAYSKGSRSFLFYSLLKRYFELPERDYRSSSKVLMPYLCWGISHKINLEETVNLYGNDIFLTLYNYELMGERLYARYPNENLLREICKYLMRDLNYSKKAYNYYNEAISKQVYLKGLEEFFVKSAFKNEIENINLYPFKLFLQNYKIDSDIKPYIYHVILTNKKCRFLIPKYRNEILEYAFYALDNKLEGRYYYSAYKFLLDNCEKFSDNILRERHIKEAEEILYDKLFLYDVIVDDYEVSGCWIKQRERKEAQYYEFYEGKAEIRAASSSFSVCFTDFENKTIINCNSVILRQVENTDIHLCLSFYSKGYINKELLIVITNYYLNLEKIPLKAIDIFEKTLNEKEISTAFKMKIMAAMGNIYYNNDEKEKAIEYYSRLDDRFLNEKLLKNILFAFLETENYEKALSIILRKASSFSDKILFNAIKKISKKEELELLLADTAYELILKGHFDRRLFEIVLRHFNGGFNEWVQLSKVLYEMGLPDKSVDEKILEMGIFISNFDFEIQNVFVRYYTNLNDFENKLVQRFIEFSCYKIFVENKEISYDLLKIFEEIFFETEYEYLGYALSCFYASHKVFTENTKKIVDFVKVLMEKRNIIFPIFKEVKDKTFYSAYIKKNQPFIYMAPLNKEVLLFYREKGSKEYTSKKMKYMRYGMHIAVIPVFYGEEIEYIFKETGENGSVETKPKIIYNEDMYLNESRKDDFFEINNAIVYSKMLRFDDAEWLIEKKINSEAELKGKIL